MDLHLDLEHPLAVALMASGITNQETWLVLKSPTEGETYFRACVQKWSSDGKALQVEFETWEQYMGRKARLAGL